MIISDDHNAVKKLIDSGTSVHSVTNDGGTALHKAAEKGDDFENIKKKKNGFILQCFHLFSNILNR